MFIFSSVDEYLSCFHFLVVMNNAALTFVYKLLYGHMFSFLLDVHLGVELLGYVVTMFNLLRTARMPFKAAAPFYIPTSGV